MKKIFITLFFVAYVSAQEIELNKIYCQNDRDMGIPVNACYVLTNNFSFGLHVDGYNYSELMSFFVDPLESKLIIDGVERPMRLWIPKDYQSIMEVEALVQTVWATRGNLSIIFPDPRTVDGDFGNWNSYFNTRLLAISGSR